MLVLTRKIQQQIQIGDNIRITILQVKGRSVRVGIEAPRELRVSRVDAASKPQPTETEFQVSADIAPAALPSMNGANAEMPAQPERHNRVETYFTAPRQSRSELKRLVAQAAARRTSTADVPDLTMPTIMAAHAAC
ncbi:MAG: carbon storage regulator [Planctomycetes bacterium]|nr:carbon storage regulator [Planctomycetota bacterium]